jgi:ferredoxin
MPSKYVIHVRQVPDRFKALTKSGVIAWEEGCLKCAICVKKQCVYQVYDKRGLDPQQMIDSIDNECMNCYRCVQGCPKELIQKGVNPEFKAMGDSHWTPDIIARLWYQAQTGKIPVSGAGYPGPFSGPGFDSIWTDMSEIVRPTRDGIHGREYISTSIDIGRFPKQLMFSDDGKLQGDSLKLLDIPLPIILRLPSFGSISEKTLKGWAMATERLGILLALPSGMIKGDLEKYKANLIPVFTDTEKPVALGNEIRMVEVVWGKNWKKTIDGIRDIYPDALLSIKLPLTQHADKTIMELVGEGCSIFHLEGTANGRSSDDESRFTKDDMRAIHQALVKEGIRNEITLLTSGGFAMAEHVAKGLICGADGVFIDFPILIALECRMCRRCEKGLSCPVEIKHAASKWVALRTINILGAWHNQLLEIMGAMGIRECRRLRGEAGRAMFFTELDPETFRSMSVLEEGLEFE